MFIKPPLMKINPVVFDKSEYCNWCQYSHFVNSMKGKKCIIFDKELESEIKGEKYFSSFYKRLEECKNRECTKGGVKNGRR